MSVLPYIFAPAAFAGGVTHFYAPAAAASIMAAANLGVSSVAIRHRNHMVHQLSHMNNQIVQLKVAVGGLGLGLLFYEPIKLGWKKLFASESKMIEDEILHSHTPQTKNATPFQRSA